MTIKSAILLILSGAILGAFLMFKLNNQEPKIIRDTQIVENTKYIDRIIKGKDGETIVEHIVEKETETVEKVKPLLPKYKVGVIGGYNFDLGRNEYGLLINKPINQDLEIGAYIKPGQKELGLTLTIGF